MGEASAVERLLVGHWAQIPAPWLALNIPAGQAGTERREHGMAEYLILHFLKVYQKALLIGALNQGLW